MNQILEKTLPAILQELEIVCATRAGQPSLEAQKLSVAVFIAQAILMAMTDVGGAIGPLFVIEDVIALINKMKNEGQLGGPNKDGPVMVPYIMKDTIPPDVLEGLLPKKDPIEMGVIKDDEGHTPVIKESHRYKLPEHLKKPPQVTPQQGELGFSADPFPGVEYQG